MSNDPNGRAGTDNASNARGDRTRDRLLDALESIAADSGIAALSHRGIARRARLHTGLIHYHYGTVERLLEEALARRAVRLSRAQLAGISVLQTRGRWSVEELVAALWQPFSSLGGALEGTWRNYLCLVARLASHERGEELLALYFDDVSGAALRALRCVLVDADAGSLREGLRFTRVLFEQEALARCRQASPPEHRLSADRRLTAFAAAGLRGLDHAAVVSRLDPRRASAP